VAHILKTVPNDKGNLVTRLDDYGWGKGPGFVYSEFLKLLAELDHHIAAGRMVVVIAHECVSNVPNPEGEDWLRYEPRLQSPKNGKGSIRHRTKEWCDHLLFVSFDLVSKGGKARGSGSRRIYCTELPTYWAKSHTLDAAIPYTQGDTTLWARLLGDK
jgi:hypothetical protein